MKKRYLLVFSLSLLITLTSTVAAQSNMKFGHVNSQKVIESLPEYKAIEETMQQETGKMEKQLTDMREEFQRSVSEYQQKASTMSAGERQQAEASLAERSQKVQNFYKLAQESLESKSRNLQEPIITKYQSAVQMVGDEGGFMYIFEVDPGMPVFRSAKSIDVSELVKAKLIKTTSTTPSTATKAVK